MDECNNSSVVYYASKQPCKFAVIYNTVCDTVKWNAVVFVNYSCVLSAVNFKFGRHTLCLDKRK